MVRAPYVLLAAVVVAACSATHRFGDVGAATVLMREEIKTLNLANPISDLQSHINAGSYRFVGVNGLVACYPHGVSPYQTDLVEKYGVRCIAGTSDALENEEHATMVKAVIKYASIYNSKLANFLRRGDAP